MIWVRVTTGSIKAGLAQEITGHSTNDMTPCLVRDTKSDGLLLLVMEAAGTLYGKDPGSYRIYTSRRFVLLKTVEGFIGKL